MLREHKIFVIGVWICCLWTQARCQSPSPYSALSPKPFYPSDSGTFTWPRGASTGIFTEGSTMNISWTTDFPNVNLWLIVNESWTSPISLVSSYSKLWYEWEVKCGQDCNEPFLLRAVNAAGSDFEQQHGGFYSYQFWVKPTDGASSSSKVPLTTMSTTADLVPTASSTTLSKTTTTSSASTSAAAGTTLEPSSPATTTNTLSTISSATTSPSTLSEPQSNTNTSLNISIAVGVSVGVGIALLSSITAFFLWRRRHRSKVSNNPYTHPPPIEMFRNGWQKPYEASLPPSRAEEHKSVLPVEAPA